LKQQLGDNFWWARIGWKDKSGWQGCLSPQKGGAPLQTTLEWGAEVFGLGGGILP
jgi:hypothetical protein